MSDTTLKFPSGKFTHTELAQHNGKTNQQVWTAYQAAINDGTIIPAGLRPNLSGKGKPSKLWEVNPNKGVATTPLTNTPPAIPTPKIQAEPRVKRQPKPVEVVQPTEAEVAKVVEKKLATVEPTKAPVVEAEPEVELSIKPLTVLTSQVETLEEKCPFCNTPLLCVRGDGRVKVWCPVNDLKVCSCSENPYGVAKNVKDAVKILTEKYFDKK